MDTFFFVEMAKYKRYHNIANRDYLTKVEGENRIKTTILSPINFGRIL